MEKNSVEKVLVAISDPKSLEIFRSIANGTSESRVLREIKELTKKQYYWRTRQLLNAGLVKRAKGRFSLTNFGLVVYHAESLIESSVDNFWKLKAIDSFQQSGQIAREERVKLIKTILNDNKIEDILSKQK